MADYIRKEVVPRRGSYCCSSVVTPVVDLVSLLYRHWTLARIRTVLYMLLSELVAPETDAVECLACRDLTRTWD